MPAFYQIGPVQNNAWHARPYAERERIFHTKRRSGKILPRGLSALKVSGKYCLQRPPGGAQECVRHFGPPRDGRAIGGWQGSSAHLRARSRYKRLLRPSPNLSPA